MNRPANVAGQQGSADFHGEKRSNETHASTTDPEARLYHKGSGKEAKPRFIGYALMENRHAFLVGTCLSAKGGFEPRHRQVETRHDLQKKSLTAAFGNLVRFELLPRQRFYSIDCRL